MADSPSNHIIYSDVNFNLENSWRYYQLLVFNSVSVWFCLIVTSSATDKKLEIDKNLENKLEIYKNLEK